MPLDAYPLNLQILFYFFFNKLKLIVFYIRTRMSSDNKRDAWTGAIARVREKHYKLYYNIEPIRDSGRNRIGWIAFGVFNDELAPFEGWFSSREYSVSNSKTSIPKDLKALKVL